MVDSGQSLVPDPPAIITTIIYGFTTNFKKMIVFFGIVLGVIIIIWVKNLLYKLYLKVNPEEAPSTKKSIKNKAKKRRIERNKKIMNKGR